MQSHTGTVDGALLPSAANTLNGQARRTAKKAPSTVTNFFKTATSIFYFFAQCRYSSQKNGST